MVAAGALSASALSACSSTSPDAASVNGTAINQSTLMRELHALGANKAFVAAYTNIVQQALAQGQAAYPIFATGTANQTYTQGFTAVVLNTDVQAALVHQEVVRRHVEPSDAQINAASAGAEKQFPSGTFTKFNAWFRHEYQVRTAESDALAKSLGPVASDTGAIGTFYKQNPQDFISTECLSHILVPSEPEAAKIRSELASGANFVDEARRYSKDTASAIKGGDLGCVQPGNFDPAFERVADTIAVNQLSQPVRSSFGWHLILVRSRELQPLDQNNSGRIQQFLQQETPVSAYVGAALTAAHVTVNPAFGTWDPVLHGVVSPFGPPANSGAPTTTAAPPSA